MLLHLKVVHHGSKTDSSNVKQRERQIDIQRNGLTNQMALANSYTESPR